MKLLLLITFATAVSTESFGGEQASREFFDLVVLARTSPDLEKAMTSAREAGMDETLLREARLMRAYQMEDSKQLSEVLKEYSTDEKFDPSHSATFQSHAEEASFLDLARGFVAIKEGSDSQAKSAFADAIWKFPGHAPVVADLINAHRWTMWLNQVRIPWEKVLRDENGELMDTKKIFGSAPFVKILLLAEMDLQATEAFSLFEKLEGNMASVLCLTSVPSHSDEEKAFLNYARAGSVIARERSDNFLTKLFPQSRYPLLIVADQSGRLLYAGAPQHPRLDNILRHCESQTE